MYKLYKCNPLLCILGYHHSMLDQCIKTEIDLEGLNVHLDKLLISINDVEFSDQLGEGIHN